MKPRAKKPIQDNRFVPFLPDTSLAELLEIQEPAFSREDPFRQLKYVEEYVRSAGCQAVLVEGHYVDRDYIEDHSLFYSRSFVGYPNSCQRLHFFRTSLEVLATTLTQLEGLWALSSDGERRSAWKAFSDDAYIGFVVIKPLSGSPVGRTILRPPNATTESVNTLLFPATRGYQVHWGGLELDVMGLPFQQQDVGVSACATTALWCALHKLRDFEEIGSPTPAQITTLATQYSLPFGRPMPSDEGLSMDQMCQALHSLKVAPNLLSVGSFRLARAYVYSALESGFAPVLVLEDASAEDRCHAVTVVGYLSTPTPELEEEEVYDLSANLVALYVHDDRIGPYHRVDPFDDGECLGLASKDRSDEPRWLVRYVLVPLHAKIRISVSGLRDIAIDILDHIKNAFEENHAPAVTFQTWITRPNKYLQTLLADDDHTGSGPLLARNILDRVSMPRYVGVVRISGSSLGKIDVLIDTTSTMKNLSFLAIAHHGSEAEQRVLDVLAAAYDCDLVSGSSSQESS